MGLVSSHAMQLRLISPTPHNNSLHLYLNRTNPLPHIKINPLHHTKHPWRVHTLCPDFKLEDVWQVQVELKEQHTLAMFMDQFKKTDKVLLKKGTAAFLFKLRLDLGKFFKWDAPQDPNREGSIRKRYAQQEGLAITQLPNPGTGSFIPVYQLENEFLSEIENDTVHATMHLSRVPLREQVWCIHMAVYVKPKGFIGKLYMVLIKPFRLWIVYPAMLRVAARTWNQYLASSK